MTDNIKTSDYYKKQAKVALSASTEVGAYYGKKGAKFTLEIALQLGKNLIAGMYILAVDLLKGAFHLGKFLVVKGIHMIKRTPEAVDAVKDLGTTVKPAVHYAKLIPAVVTGGTQAVMEAHKQGKHLNAEGKKFFGIFGAVALITLMVGGTMIQRFSTAKANEYHYTEANLKHASAEDRKNTVKKADDVNTDSTTAKKTGKQFTKVVNGKKIKLPKGVSVDHSIISPVFTNPVGYQEEFINKIAIASQKVAHKYNVFPSVLMAQACIESDFGRSTLATQGNNYFGIKGNYNGQHVNMPTREVSASGQSYYINANFMKFPTIEAGMATNAKTLRYGITGNSNFYAGAWKENCHTYKDATQALLGHYATDPNYNTVLNNLIETYGLNVLD